MNTRWIVFGCTALVAFGLGLVVMILLFDDNPRGGASPATSPTDIPPTSESSGTAPHGGPRCGEQQFRDAWKAATGGEGDEIEVALCRGQYAYVVFSNAGSDDSITERRSQCVLFRLEGGRFVDIAWGSTSHGALSEYDLPSGLDAAMIAQLFPEAGLLVAGN